MAVFIISNYGVGIKIISKHRSFVAGRQRSHFACNTTPCLPLLPECRI